MYQTFFLFLGTFVSISSHAVSFTVPETTKEKYAHLYEAEPVSTSDGGLLFHHARLFLRNGIRVLSLSGDRFEMAFQHGRLLKKEIIEGAVPESALFMERTIRNGLPQIPLVTNLIIRMFYKKISDGILDYGLYQSGVDSEQFLQEGYGLSESTGIPMQSILYGAVGPESLQVLLGQHSKTGNGPAVTALSFCSAFAVWGDATETGELLIGRNTDYPLNGYYDKSPTLIYFNPSQGQKYMAVTSAGIHNAGVVGMNEAGIYLGVHTIPTLDVSPNGMPVFFLAQTVLREARSFDDALRLFKLHQPPSGWSYLIVSTKERKIASLELSNHHRAIRQSPGSYHIQTNHYLTPEMKPHYLNVNVGTYDDTLGRYQRIQDRIAAAHGLINEHEVVSILSDKFDPFQKKNRGLGNVVAVHTTMTSVVVQPERGRIWMASGRAPVTMNDYVEFPLVDRFDPATFADTNYESIANNWYWDQEPKLAAAEQEFILAKVAFESQMDYRLAIEHMEKALAIDQENPSYHFNHAMLSLKAGEWNRAKQALLNTVRIDSYSQVPHHKYVAQYYLGRIAAHQRDRKEALRWLQTVLSEAPEKKEWKIRLAAQQTIKNLKIRSFVRFGTGGLALMLQQSDVAEY